VYHFSPLYKLTPEHVDGCLEHANTANRNEARERGDFTLQAGAFDYDTFMTLDGLCKPTSKIKTDERLEISRR